MTVKKATVVLKVTGLALAARPLDVGSDANVVYSHSATGGAKVSF